MGREVEHFTDARSRRTGEVFERATEVWTHRQELPNGDVILADPANNCWRCKWGVVYTPPRGWDESKAVRIDLKTETELEADYS